MILAAGTAAKADFVTSWTRASDWGSNEGVHDNPGPDSGGAPVWFYGWTTGGGLDSGSPWWAQPVVASTWDDDFYQYGQGVWAKGDDSNPPILAERLVHRLSPRTWQDIPVVQWLNPVGQEAVLGVAGLLTVEWNGLEGMGHPVDVEVVIALYRASTETTVALFTASVSKPIDAVSYRDSVDLEVAIGDIALMPGDALLVTHRAAHPGYDAGWVNLYDRLTIEVAPVPAPGAGVLALGGLALCARRRR